MKKLNIDLELLTQSFSFNEDSLGKEYLDTHTGEIINIPSQLNSILEGQGVEDELEDWQKELLKDAYAIKADKEGRYIIIPSIEDGYYHNTMKNFAIEKVCSHGLRERLLGALNSSQPTVNFKSIIFGIEEELDNWQDYEEEKAKEYAIKWLEKRGIKLV